MANEDSVEPLADGLKNIDIPQPEELANEIVEEAQMWEEKINEA